MPSGIKTDEVVPLARRPAQRVGGAPYRQAPALPRRDFPVKHARGKDAARGSILSAGDRGDYSAGTISVVIQ